MRLARIKRRAAVMRRAAGRGMPDTDPSDGPEDEPLESIVESMVSDSASGAAAARRPSQARR